MQWGHTDSTGSQWSKWGGGGGQGGGLNPPNVEESVQILEIWKQMSKHR